MIAMQPAAPATGTGSRSIELLVVRLQEGNQRHSFGLLVSQVCALLRQQSMTVRPTPQPAPRRAIGEGLYEDRWLPIYDLAGVLGLLSPWKMGLVTTIRPYLLVLQGSGGQQIMLSVDDVTEIGMCPLERIHPLPEWLRRQIAPPLVWGGLYMSDLALAQSAAGGETDRRAAAEAAALLLLIDCGPLTMG